MMLVKGWTVNAWLYVWAHGEPAGTQTKSARIPPGFMIAKSAPPVLSGSVFRPSSCASAIRSPAGDSPVAGHSATVQPRPRIVPPM